MLMNQEILMNYKCILIEIEKSKQTLTTSAGATSGYKMVRGEAERGKVRVLECV